MPHNFISSSQFQRKQKKLGLLSIYKFYLVTTVQDKGKYTVYLLYREKKELEKRKAEPCKKE
jgi:hypothetical protein